MKAVHIENLTKKYGEQEVLKGIDLDIETGDFFALLGHNGAGKTTTIGILTDLVAKTSGQVSVFGNNIDTDFAQAKQCIGVVPQEFNFNMWEKVKNIPIIQAGFYGIDKKTAAKRSEELLRTLELWEHRDKEAMALSGGMKRRLMIARALVHRPKLLILDEPTAGVDVELRTTMWDFVKQLNANGTTILLTTHYLEEVEALCNKVAIISKGKIVKNTTTKELLSSIDEEIFVIDINKQTLVQKFGGSSDDVQKICKHICDQLIDFKAHFISHNEIELTISRKHNLNSLFTILNNEDIGISSMRNKVNRIEQLFINLTK